MEKSSRPIRNRRHSRKAWPPGDNIHHRTAKRLFTPEIKKQLKDWLVRRRENPYPSRDEKKTLAVETGLTYTQICNWFANWRRKLKNSGREPQKKTWGNLIKNYNENAKGNVEQFSICSGDSIWGDDEMFHYGHLSHMSHSSSSPPPSSMGQQYGYQFYNNNNNSEIYNRQFIEYVQRNPNDTKMNNNFYTNVSQIEQFFNGKKPMVLPNSSIQAQCFQISSTTDDLNTMQKFEGNTIEIGKTIRGSAKYKNHIMEKYLRGLDEKNIEPGTKKGPELSKWLESAANFTPNKNNYIDWNSTARISKCDKKRTKPEDLINLIDTNIHQKEELDAAVALTSLAGNFRNRLINN